MIGTTIYAGLYFNRRHIKAYCLISRNRKVLGMSKNYIALRSMQLFYTFFCIVIFFL